MRLISSQLTFFYKRVFPVLWFGILLAVVVVSLLKAQAGELALPFLLAPAGMAVFGYIFMRMFMFDLLDQVFDDGDALVLRNGGREERVALSDIKNVGCSPFINPPRVVLSLRRGTIFGDEVAFCAPMRVMPFVNSPVVTDLIERVDRARRR
jgi:hypothetical protein